MCHLLYLRDKALTVQARVSPEAVHVIAEPGAGLGNQGVQDECMAGASRLHGAVRAEGLPGPEVTCGAAKCCRQAHGCDAWLGGARRSPLLVSRADRVLMSCPTSLS